MVHLELRLSRLKVEPAVLIEKVLAAGQRSTRTITADAILIHEAAVTITHGTRSNSLRDATIAAMQEMSITHEIHGTEKHWLEEMRKVQVDLLGETEGPVEQRELQPLTLVL